MPDASVGNQPGLKRLLPKGQNVAWGLGSLGTITMINSISNLYLFFLVGVMSMSPAVAGLLIFVSKIIDMVSDPAMGVISDRAKTRWGRRRPFMFVATFACPLSLIWLFSLPEGSSTTWTYAYVEIGLIFYTLALTTFNVPYLAMPAEMTDDYHERSNIMSFRALFLVGGSFVGSAISGLLLSQMGSGPDAYRLVSYVLAGVVFFAMLGSVLGTGSARFTNYTPPSIPIKNQLRLFLVNKPFLTLGAVKAIQFLQLSAGSAATLFFFVGVLQKDESLLFPFGASLTIGSVLSLPFWLPLIKRFGKKEIFVAALILQTLTALSWMLATPTEPLWIFMIRAVVLGFSSGGILVCSQSMITDTIAYDRALSGLNREGMFSSAMSFIEKSTHALGPLIVGVLLAAFGFDDSVPRGQPQPESAQTAIYIGQVWLPVLCSVGMLIGVLFYHLDEEKLNNATTHDLAKETT